MADIRILMVEDDLDSQEMIATMLQHMNFEVATADNAEEAAELLFDDGESYDVIVIDLALPGKDGWELLAEILENPDTEQLPCIAVTAFHQSKLREDALRAGFTAYFPKPIDGTQLAREIERLV